MRKVTNNGEQYPTNDWMTIDDTRNFSPPTNNTNKLHLSTNKTTNH